MADNTFREETLMTQHRDTGRLSRRRILKATGAVVTGLAAPTFLRIG
jgi:hypothetical protein